MIGKPYSEKPNVRLCVQRRLVCSAGVSPAMLEVRRHIAWVARWRETKILKPIDNVTGRVTEGPIRAMKRGNARGAKGSYFWQSSDNKVRQG